MSINSFLIPEPTMKLLFSESATLAEVTAGTDPDARTTLQSGLTCTEPQEMNADDKERARMASITTLLRVFTAVPTVTISADDRFIYSGTDYRIRKVRKVPAGKPLFYELFIEDEHR